VLLPDIKKNGVSGQDIVDEKHAIDSRNTSGELIHNLKNYNIPSEDWEEVIDAARDIKIPVIQLLRVKDSLGIQDIGEVLESIEEMKSDISLYAVQNRITETYAWHSALQIYSKEGKGNPTRTIDLLVKQQIPDSEESVRDSMEIEIERAERVLSRNSGRF